MHTLFILVCVWFGANLTHAVWVQTRRYFWERHITRDPDGLLPHATAFTVGKGPIALLLIHGFADTPYIWKRMSNRLASSGMFTCHAMRLPGSGQASAQARTQSLALWRQAIDDELDRLCVSHKHIWVIGHSLGAALAIDAALRHDTIDGVAVFAPMIQVSNRRSPLLPPAVWFRLASVALCLSPTFESCFSAENVAKDDASFTYLRDRFIPFCVYRGLFELIRSNRKWATRLGCPVFAATAEYDTVVDTPAALRWLSGCSGPKHICALAGIGHVIPLEIGWQSLSDDLARFIREQSQRT